MYLIFKIKINFVYTIYLFLNSNISFYTFSEIYFKMGNYCNQICLNKGDLKFNPAQGEYNSPYSHSSLIPYNYNTISIHRHPDEPNPHYAHLVSMQPEVTGVVAEVFHHQNTIKPFQKDNVTGTDLPPY